MQTIARLEKVRFFGGFLTVFLQGYPAPGYRSNDKGTLNNVGNSGCDWSASVDDDNTHNLDFYYGGIYPQFSGGRVNGRQVRCLQE